MNQRQMRQLGITAAINKIIHPKSNAKKEQVTEDINSDVEPILSQEKHIPKNAPLVIKSKPAAQDNETKPEPTEIIEAITQVILEPKVIKEQSQPAIEEPAPQARPVIKQTMSKLVQFRIDQACLFTKNSHDTLLTSSIQADIIRELVICSLDFSERNMPILSLLLHCPTAHLKALYENLKTDQRKKLSIHIFRQLQSDLQPKVFE